MIQLVDIKQAQMLESYKKAAPHYDTWGALFESRAKKRCIELLAAQDGMSILDVGVGTGHIFEELVRRNPNGRNEGIDLSPEMLDFARNKFANKNLKNFNLRQGSVYNLPYAPRSFDRIISTYLIELLPPREYGNVLTSLRQLLKPEGQLVLAGMIEGKSWYHRPAKWACRKHPAWNGGFRWQTAALELHVLGFADIHTEQVTQLLFPTRIVSASALARS